MTVHQDPLQGIVRHALKHGRIGMSIAWSGTVHEHDVCKLGPLAVVAPLLEDLDVACIASCPRVRK